MRLENDATTRTHQPRQRDPAACANSQDEHEHVATRIGRFSLLDAIGQGGMGRVYAAYDPQLDRRVALKVLLEPEAVDGQSRLLREAHALAKLAHPNVVAVHEVGVENEQGFVAMEFVDGVTLRQWLAENPVEGRDVKQVLRLLLQAGRGLAAAHAAGIVHRDFKPGNVLIGADGRVRVADFGLARVANVDTVGDEYVGVVGVAAGAGPDAKHATVTAAVAGTPGYMAPEQWYGRALDHRTDQFAFCCVAWEVAFGVRPFDADTPAERLALIESGRAKRGVATVPNKLEALLLRGLRADPARRHASMERLLAQLAPVVSESSPRRTGLVTAVALTLAGAALVGVWANESHSARQQICSGAASHMDGIWDQRRRDRVRSAIIDTGLSYAPRVWDRTRSTLDAFASDWVGMHTQTCEATSIRREQSEQVMDLRMACLQRARQNLDAVASVLASADGDVVARAHEVVGTLPELGRCADVDALLADVAPPGDDEASAVESARGQLAEVDAQIKAGRYDEAQVRLEAAEMALRDVDYAPAKIELELRTGDLLEQQGEFEPSAARYRQALELATADRSIEGMQEASSSLVWVLGQRQGRLADALNHGELAVRLAASGSAAEAQARHNIGAAFELSGKFDDAEAQLIRALTVQEELEGEGSLSVARYRAALGSLRRTQGRIDDAVQLYRAAYATYEQALDGEHPTLATALNNVAMCYLDNGRNVDAEREFRRALDIRRRTLNADHPHIASSHNNLGLTYRRQGRYADAAREHEAALRVRLAAFGPNHRLVGDSYNNLGVVHYHAGEYALAEKAYSNALESRVVALGPEHPDIGGVYNNLGEVYAAQKRYSDAEAANRRAIEVFAVALRPDHPRAMSPVLNLGVLFNEQRRFDEAEQQLDHAKTVLAKELGDDHPQVATVMGQLANSYLGQRRFQSAIDAAQRALTILAASDVEPREVGDVRFVLARALWDSRQERFQAIESARAALADYARSESSATPARSNEVTAWLEQRESTAK